MAGSRAARAADKADVRDALSVAAYARFLGVELRRSGDGWRGPCPLCGGSRRASKFSISADGGSWCCHGCGERGDVFQLAQLANGCDFPTAVAKLADLAGITTAAQLDGPARAKLERERAARRRTRDARERRDREQAEKRRVEAERRAPAQWARLDRDSAQGRAYLASRGIVGLGPADVRFGRRYVCVALRQLDGAITNVVGRRRGAGDPKVCGLRSCGTRGAFGDWRKLDASTGPVVLVEGLFDWLSGRVLWPDRLILGAHGGGRLASIARDIAPELARRGRALMLVPHRDRNGAGERFAARAATAAMEAGMPAAAIHRFEVAPAVELGDLNDDLRRKRGTE